MRAGGRAETRRNSGIGTHLRDAAQPLLLGIDQVVLGHHRLSPFRGSPIKMTRVTLENCLT
jgi:hypothetical protein